MIWLTWNMLPDIVPHTVGVVHPVPCQGTQEHCQGELVEVSDGLLDPEVISRVGVVVVLR